MQVRICDNCEKSFEGSYLRNVDLSVWKEGLSILAVVDKDFCSYGCLEEYVEESLKGEDRLTGPNE